MSEPYGLGESFVDAIFLAIQCAIRDVQSLEFHLFLDRFDLCQSCLRSWLVLNVLCQHKDYRFLGPALRLMECKPPGVQVLAPNLFVSSDRNHHYVSVLVQFVAEPNRPLIVEVSICVNDGHLDLLLHILGLVLAFLDHLCLARAFPLRVDCWLVLFILIPV